MNSEISPNTAIVALRLTVYNHPGVMTHICNLFARRAFNMEGLFVMPSNGTGTSLVWILVNDDKRLEQVIRQTKKLHDVLDVSLWPDGARAFHGFSAFMQSWEGSTNPKIKP